jgi:hypothetical protein
MPVITIILVLVVVGVLLWLVNTYLAPYIWPPFVKIIDVIAIVAVVLWLLNMFFPLGQLFNFRMGR